MYGKFSGRFFFPVLLGLCIFLVFNRHSKSSFNDYHSINWADAGGYYVYLPAAMIYDFKADQFPDSIDRISGDGFHLNLEKNKVFTKYNYGVALLEAPFFFIAHLTAPLGGFVKDGYNRWYYSFLMIGGVFYMIAGLFFFRKIIRANGFSDQLSDLMVVILLCATNVFYYGINSPGFSHVYSFFLFSLFIWLTKKFYKEKNTSDLILIAAVFAIALLVRLTNALILIYFVLYGLSSVRNRIREIFSPRVLLAFGTMVFLFFIPQLLYWKYVSGNYFTDMYGSNEHFNFAHPRIPEILFSPYNGLLLYTPIVLVFILIAFISAFKRDIESLSVSLIILLTVYVFSSWYSWTYGCSYGSRPFSEFMVFFILPFSGWILKAGRRVKISVLALSILFAIFNINTIYHYDGCWYGEIWDWKEYFRVILR